MVKLCWVNGNKIKYIYTVCCFSMEGNHTQAMEGEGIWLVTYWAFLLLYKITN